MWFVVFANATADFLNFTNNKQQIMFFGSVHIVYSDILVGALEICNICISIDHKVIISPLKVQRLKHFGHEIVTSICQQSVIITKLFNNGSHNLTSDSLFSVVRIDNDIVYI
jgi:hypothetical protein